jgi:polyhydroxyalkanoate synthesis repressor PhaR
MPLIKRYPNRKLYDTDAKKYITLQRISELIRNEEEVQVIDNATGEDITTLTLTQIIYEQEKQHSGNLPSSILTSLIQASGDRLSIIQKAFSSSISYWQQIDEEIKNRIQKLVTQGEITEMEGSRLLTKLIRTPRARWKEAEYQQEIEAALDQRQVPKREEIQNLMDQLDQLTEQLKANHPED